MATADTPSLDYTYRNPRMRRRVGAGEDVIERSPIQIDLCYKMTHARRGCALIFNNETFVHFGKRTGTDKDQEILNHTLGNLGFEVCVKKDQTAHQIRETLLDVAKWNHSNYDCFVCVFLTHGDNGIIFGTDGHPESFEDVPSGDSNNQTWLMLKDVFDIFRGDQCRSLIGKPKIFIVQACRGRIKDEPARKFGLDYEPPVVQEIEVGVEVTIPTEADFLISFSSSEGYVSIRELEKGTWFIQDLGRVLEKAGKTRDFIQLLTVVNKLVSERIVEDCEDPELVGKKQMPCFLSKLTRQLYLTDK